MGGDSNVGFVLKPCFLRKDSFKAVACDYYEVNNNELVLSFSNYGGSFCSSFNVNNIYGLQFHPEKSHNSGIKILKNFAQLDHA